MDEVVYDAWDIAALAFFLAMLAGLGLYLLIDWVNRNNPFTYTDRSMAARRRMATDWQRPDYLPDSWQ